MHLDKIKVQEKQKVLMEGLVNISNAFSSSISQGLEGSCIWNNDV